MERADEFKMIALLQQISKSSVDSANLDILEAFIECAEADETLTVDPILLAIVLASRLTDKCIEHWDHNDDAEAAMYVTRKHQLFKELK